MPKKIYVDTCALNRPFDDQAQASIRLEAEAVEHLLRAVGGGTLEWILSDVIVFEVSKCPDEERRERLKTLYQKARHRVPLSEAVSRRARSLRTQGLRDLDALHLAAAEEGGAEVLITTDDRFIRTARMLQPPSLVRVENPAVYELEVFQ